MSDYESRPNLTHREPVKAHEVENAIAQARRHADYKAELPLAVMTRNEDGTTTAWFVEDVATINGQVWIDCWTPSDRGENES